MCVACYVDEAAKDKIIAYSAKFQEMTQSPYGSDDEIGMLHLIDGRAATLTDGFSSLERRLKPSRAASTSLRRKRPNVSTTKPKAMTTTPVRTQARKVRSFARDRNGLQS